MGSGRTVLSYVYARLHYLVHPLLRSLQPQMKLYVFLLSLWAGQISTHTRKILYKLSGG